MSYLGAQNCEFQLRQGDSDNHKQLINRSLGHLIVLKLGLARLLLYCSA